MGLLNVDSQELDEYILYHIMHSATNPEFVDSKTGEWRIIIVCEKVRWSEFLIRELRQIASIMRIAIHYDRELKVLTFGKLKIRFTTRGRNGEDVVRGRWLNQLFFYVDDFIPKTEDLDYIKSVAHPRIRSYHTKYSIIHP